MTNYHPDVQRAYDAHCAGGYMVPDDETGPQEATSGAVRDFPCCDAPRDGAGLREAVEALADEWERTTTRARPAFLVAADELRAALASIKGQPS